MKALLSLVAAAAIALGAGTASATDYYHYYPGICFQQNPTDTAGGYAAGKFRVTGTTAFTGYCPMETESAAHHIDNLLQFYIYTYQVSSSYTPSGQICARNSNGNNDAADTECAGDIPVSTGNGVNSWIFFDSTDLAGVKAAATSGWPIWAEVSLANSNAATRVVAIYQY